MQLVFSRQLMVNADWTVCFFFFSFFFSPPHFHVFTVIVAFSPLTLENWNESFTFPSRWDWGVCFLCQGLCMYVCRHMKLFKDDVGGRGWTVFCLFYFVATIFFFCCKLVSVIDPIASLTPIAFGCPTHLGLLYIRTPVGCRGCRASCGFDI